MIKQIDFQDLAVDWLLDKTLSPTAKENLVINAPTGCGKTVILLKYIDKLFVEDKDIAVVWLCPGKGDLEEQSRKRMQEFFPALTNKDLFGALSDGFTRGSATFLNWERVTKTGNKAITEGERDNLYDRIKQAHNNGVKFLIIIDEEHSNNTTKAKDLLRYFDAIHTVRVSATTITNKSQVEYYEIDEQAVIDEGLITKAISVNEGVFDGMAQDDALLLELADRKRKEIIAAYGDKKIRPLVLIQFPNAEPEKIEAVENKLREMGYTRENKMVAAWLSGDKADIPDDLTENNSQLAFLFIKQAINTGWDCPRAKILVKLREHSGEAFQIQTIGRIRRMPEAKHYENRVLDLCYVYTFDDEYHAGLMSALDKAYIPHRVFLKEKCKGVSFVKELRDMDGGEVDFKTAYAHIYRYFVETYSLTSSKDDNILKFKAKGYVFEDCLLGKIINGVFVRTSELSDAVTTVITRTPISTHEHGFLLRHTINDFKKIVDIPYETMRPIFDRLFSFKYRNKDKIFGLGLKEFYAFILNNQHLLREDFRNLAAGVNVQNRILEPKKGVFTIPEEELYHFDPVEKNPELLNSSAYEDYTTAFVTTNCGKSDPEIIFEQFCEDCESVDWVYKNGDSGQDYLSLVYYGNLGEKQKLFYPDYIVRLKDGTLWILETKGGQRGSQDQNIDKQILNKFETFKRYATEHNIKWGFVRPKNHRLYLNNTEYSVDMNADCWVRLDECFKI